MLAVQQHKLILLWKLKPRRIRRKSYVKHLAQKLLTGLHINKRQLDKNRSLPYRTDRLYMVPPLTAIF